MVLGETVELHYVLELPKRSTIGDLFLIYINDALNQNFEGQVSAFGDVLRYNIHPKMYTITFGLTLIMT